MLRAEEHFRLPKQLKIVRVYSATCRAYPFRKSGYNPWSGYTDNSHGIARMPWRNSGQQTYPRTCRASEYYRGQVRPFCVPIGKE